MKRKNTLNIILVSFIFVLSIFFNIGYAARSQVIKFQGQMTYEYKKPVDVEIISVKPISGSMPSGLSYDQDSISISNVNGTFSIAIKNNTSKKKTVKVIDSLHELHYTNPNALIVVSPSYRFYYWKSEDDDTIIDNYESRTSFELNANSTLYIAFESLTNGSVEFNFEFVDYDDNSTVIIKNDFSKYQFTNNSSNNDIIDVDYYWMNGPIKNTEIELIAFSVQSFSEYESFLTTTDDWGYWDISASYNDRVRAYYIYDSDNPGKYGIMVISESNIMANEDMSYFCYGLSSLNSFYSAISEGTVGIDYTLTKTMQGFFKGTSILYSFNFNESSTSHIRDMSYMFANSCTEAGGLIGILESLATLDTYSVTDMSHMFENIGKNMDDLEEESYDSYAAELLLNCDNVKDMSYMFRNARGLGDITIRFNSGFATNMSHMFENASFGNLNVNNLLTHNVTDMSYMFQGIKEEGKDLDLSSFDTSKVTNMKSMFGASKFNSVNLSSFNTSNVTDMNQMFFAHYLTSTTTLDLSNFTTTNLKDADNMFAIILYYYDAINISNAEFSKVNKNALFYQTIPGKTVSIKVKNNTELQWIKNISLAGVTLKPTLA